jgi:hypothetical protein
MRYIGLRGSGHAVTYNADRDQFEGPDAAVVRRLNSVLDDERAEPKKKRRSAEQVLRDEFGENVLAEALPEPASNIDQAAEGGESLDSIEQL